MALAHLAVHSWHGLAETPSGYGLIETLGTFDFNCVRACLCAPWLQWPSAPLAVVVMPYAVRPPWQ